LCDDLVKSAKQGSLEADRHTHSAENNTTSILRRGW